jgi:hypothetical protein
MRWRAGGGQAQGQDGGGDYFVLDTVAHGLFPSN